MKLNKLSRKVYIPTKESFLIALKQMKNRGDITQYQYLESVRRARATSDLEFMKFSQIKEVKDDERTKHRKLQKRIS